MYSRPRIRAARTSLQATCGTSFTTQVEDSEREQDLKTIRGMLFLGLLYPKRTNESLRAS